MEFTTISQAKKLTGLSYLGSVNSSSKIVKNQKVGVNTYVLYLLPADLSGYNVCSYASKECKEGCLATSGRNAMEIISGKDRINKSRLKKTKMFHENQNFFMSWLIAEIKANQIKSEKAGFIFSVRLNGTSDIDWAKVKHNGLNVFEHFPTVQFYDYTKNPAKFNYLAPNYNLTFSYTGININTCKTILNMGFNIAVVFNVKNVNQFPDQFLGFNVVNGDETDYRPNDPKNSVVGLKWKKIANKEHNERISTKGRFVVQMNDVNNTYHNYSDMGLINSDVPRKLTTKNKESVKV